VQLQAEIDAQIRRSAAAAGGGSQASADFDLFSGKGGGVLFLLLLGLVGVFVYKSGYKQTCTTTQEEGCGWLAKYIDPVTGIHFASPPKDAEELRQWRARYGHLAPQTSGAPQSPAAPRTKAPVKHKQPPTSPKKPAPSAPKFSGGVELNRP